LIAVLSFCYGCGDGSTKNAVNPDEIENGILIKTEKLEKKNYSYTLDFSGVIKPFERVDIGLKIAGRVDRLYFDEGDNVLKGDILATLENDELKATVRQAEASYHKALNTYERSRKLLDDGTISPSEIEIAEADYKIKMAALDLTRIQLENSTLFTPISGKLAFRNIEEKEVARLNTPYFTIMDINDVILEIGVPEYQIAELYEGKRATVRLEAYPEKVFTGEIYKVAMAADDFNKLFKVEIRIKNMHEILKPGMIALSQVEVTTFENVYLIPLNAIIDSNKGKYIYLAKNGVAKRKFLNHFFAHNSNIIVTEPLNDSDRLVIKGQQLLEDGMKVYEK